MAKASDNPFPSVLIVEGTEPAAPAAGQQRLYIDSTTHHLTRTDSSGNEVDLENVGAGTYPKSAEATGTATNPTNSTTTYAAVDTASDVTIAAAAGDKLLISPHGRWQQNANIGWMDAATIVSAAIVNYCSGLGSTGSGHQSWMHNDVTADRQTIGAPMLYTVQSGDISGGNVTIRIIFRSNAANAVGIAMDANTKFGLAVINLGPN